jgi:hypothetical protein
MSVFLPDQVEQIMLILGYGALADYGKTVVKDHLESNFSDVVVIKVTELLEELDEIDLKLKEAREDSYVMSIASTQLNYASHVSHLKNEGSRLLETISTVLDVPIRANKYRPKNSGASYVSYW